MSIEQIDEAGAEVMAHEIGARFIEGARDEQERSARSELVDAILQVADLEADLVPVDEAEDAIEMVVLADVLAARGVPIADGSAGTLSPDAARAKFEGRLAANGARAWLAAFDKIEALIDVDLNRATSAARH